MVPAGMPPADLEKLKRLLAMTVARGASENEAAIALRMANSLMEKYGLSQAEIDLDATGHLKKDKITENYSKPYWMASWEKELSHVPEFLLPVSIIWHLTADRHIRLRVVGTEQDSALAIEIYAILRKELLKISREEPDGVSRRSFLFGCAQTLRFRSSQMRREREKAERQAEGGSPVDPGFALVVVKSNDIKAFVKNIPGLKQAGVRGPSEHDPIAYQRGQKAGERINLHFGASLPGKGGAE